MTLLALMLAQWGDTANAIRQMEWVLSICEPALGAEHRTTARVLNGLGRLYAANEETYDRARSLYERALAIYERLRGPYHPQTALVLNNLAALLADMDDHGAALPLLERSLAIHEGAYGMGNWRTSFVLVNLADLCSAHGDYGTARTLLERALIIREGAWGASHPETVTCLRKLVAALGKLYEEGDERALLDNMALYPCLTSLEKASGALSPANAGMPGAHLDPDQAASNLHHLLARLEVKLAQPPHSAAEQADLDAAKELAVLADKHSQMEDFDSAASMLDEALSIQERVLGENHLDHVNLLKQLAYLREVLGQHSAVLPLMQRIADIHVHVLGEDHPATAIALSELMMYHADKEDRSATRALQARIVHSMEHTLGPEDPRVMNARRTYEMLGSETRTA
ncbi:MAG: tetratricopeptide repeat protein, partial [Anaerolineae bacterium]